MLRLGLDIGTKNIILAYKSGDKKKIRHEVNGFLRIPKSDGFTKQLLINSEVAYVEYGNDFVALGKKAEELSYAFNKTLERPMADGVISGTAEEAMDIMAIIIHSIIGEINEDAILYYCIPADALNMKTNVAFHDKIVNMIISQYEGSAKIEAHPINEARSIVIGHVPDKTAIGISWGSGMINVCYCLYGIEVFSFSIVGSGDRIDTESAMKFGYDPTKPLGDYKETPTSICRRKENKIKDKPFSLLNCPEDVIGKTIYVNYGIIIEDVIKKIIGGFKDHEEKARISRPIPIVVAGGTASPEGFIEYVRSIIDKCDVPFEIGEVTITDRPLYAVAEGCLEAAVLHDSEDGS